MHQITIALISHIPLCLNREQTDNSRFKKITTNKRNLLYYSNCVKGIISLLCFFITFFFTLPNM